MTTQHGMAPSRRSVTLELILGALICGVLLGGVGGWAATTNLDGAIVARGQLAVSGNVKQVQHRDGGIVERILVRDGMRVEAGDEMLRLDDTALRGNYAIVEAQLVDLVAKRRRLQAEQLGVTDMADTTPFTALDGLDSELSRALAAETALFQARRTAIAGQKAGIAEQINQLKAGVGGLDARLGATREQVRLIGLEVKSTQSLMDQGLTTQRQLLTLQRAQAELNGTIGQIETEIAQSNIAISRSGLEISQIDLVQREQAERDLREVDSRIAELMERRIAARDQLDRLVVRAPQTGLVSQLAVHTIGGVIAPGATVALIVPDGDQLVVEARVRPTDIDMASVGQSAEIRLQTVDARLLPPFDGKVTSLSADVIVQPQTRDAYYLARITIADEDRLRRERALVPGMPVEVFLATTARRTALQYLLGPLMEPLSHAMREG
ncbi:MAG: HlyD family type I secretion periplasmic adaptor subunit [Mesorhizobium sp.]|nr:HlyD family type I secretion periplasmic adaptor subunit [Mesorhizobium sp.]MBL8580526.1 HlyD family type I secretion periplasmic adaptor subunit [Mesorhizobium sp.]